MKRVFTVLLITCFILSIFPNGFVTLGHVLRTVDGDVEFYVRYVDYEHQIVDAFYAVFSNNPNLKLVYLEGGVVFDKNGQIILDLRNCNPAFFGYKIEFSYPKNKKYSPGVNLDPYFGSKDRVGDTQKIEWNTETKTFFKRRSLAP